MSGKDLEGLCYGNLGPALGSGLKPGLNPRITPFQVSTLQKILTCVNHHPTPRSNTPWRMDGKWWGNSFLLGSNYVANHDG
jgi:hypothetical protein